MAIITISRGSFSHGKEVAEKVAQRLRYECIGRDVLLEASKEYNIPEIKLIHALKDVPSIFDKLTYKKEKYIAFIQAAILEHFKKDNIVYHGFAGHFFVKGIAHVLKVRVTADLEDRVKIVMNRDNISREKALHFIEKLDEGRSKWSEYLYGIDTWDSKIYDLVIHIQKLTIQDAVDMISHSARLEKFQTTPESKKTLDNLALASRVKASLMEVKPNLQVTSQNGIVFVKTEASMLQESELAQKIQEISKGIPGVRETRINVIPSGVEAIG